MCIIKMVQQTPHIWRIETPNGTILQSNVISHSAYEAEEYIKRYISSFPNWDYRLILLIKNTKVIKK